MGLPVHNLNLTRVVWALEDLVSLAIEPQVFDAEVDGRRIHENLTGKECGELVGCGLSPKK
jgi:hypothetical protein